MFIDNSDVKRPNYRKGPCCKNCKFSYLVEYKYNASELVCIIKGRNVEDEIIVINSYICDNHKYKENN